uniref:Fascin domain-containing protein n=1 Tax=Ascaris lumbricoides TaxID=6252 RepID=A0A0M3I5C1_ASCLU
MDAEARFFYSGDSKGIYRLTFTAACNNSILKAIRCDTTFEKNLQRGKWFIFEHLSNLHKGEHLTTFANAYAAHRCRDDEHVIHITCEQPRKGTKQLTALILVLRSARPSMNFLIGIR